MGNVAKEHKEIQQVQHMFWKTRTDQREHKNIPICVKKKPPEIKGDMNL